MISQTNVGKLESQSKNPPSEVVKNANQLGKTFWNKSPMKSGIATTTFHVNSKMEVLYSLSENPKNSVHEKPVRRFLDPAITYQIKSRKETIPY